MRLKEHEITSRQMRLDYMVKLPNQFEHRADVNRMRAKLASSEKKIRELKDGDVVVVRDRFNEFFRCMGQNTQNGPHNREQYLLEQFLLDYPNHSVDKLQPEMLTRDEMAEVMAGTKKRKHGVDNPQDFASCMKALGGKLKCCKGVRHWVNVEMTRTPYFAWDV